MFDKISPGDARSIERLMSSKDWVTLESLLLRYEESRLEGGSIKRANEFDTIWFAAFHEGSKGAIRGFLGWLEKAAREAPEK